MSANKGSFWRKVAGAFVEMDDPAPGAPAPSSDADAAETAALVAQLDGSAKPAPPPPTIKIDIEEGQAFSEIYNKAGVPVVHQTAEQLLTILDGLAAMPKEACRLAIKAMDDADDRWTIADVQTDAERKRQVLQGAIDGLQNRISAAEKSAMAERESADNLLSEAEAAILAQITQLQTELEEFRTAAVAKKAAADAQVAATRDVVARESARLQSELFRLSRVTAFFETTSPINVPPPLPRG